jgi:hypothetical protein
VLLEKIQSSIWIFAISAVKSESFRDLLEEDEANMLLDRYWIAFIFHYVAEAVADDEVTKCRGGS